MIRARSLPPDRATLVSMLEPRIQQHFFESADLSYQASASSLSVGIEVRSLQSSIRQ